VSVDAAIAEIPTGWRIYTVDMSIEMRARVMLKGPMYPNENGVQVPDYACEARSNLAAAIAAAADRARNTYRGWEMSFVHPPIPFRDWDWQATHPDYDGAPDANDGRQVSAETRELLIAEIDAWFEEQAA